MTAEQLAEVLRNSPFQWAKTMPAIAHEYTPRRKWADEKAFEEMVQSIRDHGYKEKWGRTTYVYFEANGYKYWSMGDTLPNTTVVNRARPQLPTYDDIAPAYDALFAEGPAAAENEQLREWLQPWVRAPFTVLDIGCGTGLLLDLCKVPHYRGIDPSEKMLDRLREKHPLAPVRKQSFEQVVGKYDTITALFSASYLKQPWNVKQHLASPATGQYFLMFYKPGYFPVTYQKTEKIISHHSFKEEQLRDWFNYVTPFGNYLIASSFEL